MKVVGIGQCSLDYLALIGSYPRADSKEEVLAWEEQGGGPVATALVALSRLDVPCGLHGVIGDDEAGRKIVRSLDNEGIDISGLVTRPGCASQSAFIAIEKGTASRTIFWRRPTGKPLSPDELSDGFLKDASFLLMDGLMAEVSLFAARQARAAGVRIMLDAGRARPGMLELARACDYVVASEECARDFGWALTEESVGRERVHLGVPVLSVTLGSRGSLTASAESSFRTPAFGVEAVDTTGAGDVFHGGYVYGVLMKWSLDRAVLFASAMAAMKCRAMGGRTGIPRHAEVAAFLGERGFDLSGFSPR